MIKIKVNKPISFLEFILVVLSILISIPLFCTVILIMFMFLIICGIPVIGFFICILISNLFKSILRFLLKLF